MHAQPKPPDGDKARRVYLLLREEISNGDFTAGTLLPGENRLAETFDVSRVTVRKALEALAADGWIEKRLGAGSVVLERPAEDQTLAADLASLMPQIVEMDRATTARLMAFSYGTAPAYVAKALNLAQDAKVQRAVRVRSAGERPFSYLTTYVPEDIARSYDETDLASQPLFRLLERTGVRIDGAKQSVTAALATPDVADALAVSEGSPLLSLRRTVWDASGRGVEYLAALYRPDMFRLEMTLSRVGTGDARHWEPVIGEVSE
jgi:GntR family transcriptional regulator